MYSRPLCANPLFSSINTCRAIDTGQFLYMPLTSREEEKEKRRGCSSAEIPSARMPRDTFPSGSRLIRSRSTWWSRDGGGGEEGLARDCLANLSRLFRDARGSMPFLVFLMKFRYVTPVGCRYAPFGGRIADFISKGFVSDSRWSCCPRRGNDFSFFCYCFTSSSFFFFRFEFVYHDSFPRSLIVCACMKSVFGANKILSKTFFIYFFFIVKRRCIVNFNFISISGKNCLAQSRGRRLISIYLAV